MILKELSATAALLRLPLPLAPGCAECSLAFRPSSDAFCWVFAGRIGLVDAASWLLLALRSLLRGSLPLNL